MDRANVRKNRAGQKADYRVSYLATWLHQELTQPLAPLFIIPSFPLRIPRRLASVKIDSDPPHYAKLTKKNRADATTASSKINGCQRLSKDTSLKTQVRFRDHDFRVPLAVGLSSRNLVSVFFVVSLNAP